MKGSSYRDRDYAFGQTILTLRIMIGLTQVVVAEHLGVSRKAVGEWESGLTYPKAEHLKALIALTIEQQAWPFGREEAEIRAFWKAARQKVLLDEAWRATLLSHEKVSPASLSVEKASDAAHALAPPSGGGQCIDWGDAPDVARFYGREWELSLFSTWVVQERCRVVSVLGQGGIGKSVLATQVMHRVAEDFEVVIWRSLRDVPTCEALLGDCLQVLAPQALSSASASLESLQDLLLECLRGRRVLLVHDNLESFLEEGEDSGHMRPGYEGFDRVLRRIAETEHRSCLLLTSREKPSDLVPLEGSRAPVRALRLARLDAEACRQLLAEKGVAGSTSQQTRLIEAYAVTLYDVAWSPAGTRLASAGSDTLVSIWESDGRTPPKLLRGHSWIVYGVAWSSDGRWLSSSGLDNTVRVWDATTEAGVQTVRDPNHVDTSFFGVEWSPDGRFLAGRSYQQEVQVWEVSTGTRRWVGRGQPTTIRRVAWSPDGTRLASGGGGRGRGELFVWCVHSGELLHTLSELSEIVYALAWSPTLRAA